jgi:predicted TPR repeat methyltransferase
MDPSGPMGFLVPLLDYKLGLFFRKRLPVVLHRPRARRHLQRAYSNLPLDHPKKNVRQFWLATLDETTEMTRCPPEYIVSFFFPTLSNKCDDLLVGKLAYKTPTVLRQL